MHNYDPTIIKESINEAIRTAIIYCAVKVDEGNAKEASEMLCVSTHTINVLAQWFEEFGNRQDSGIEIETPFQIDARWMRAILESPEPQTAHRVAHDEQLTTAQIRQRFPTEKRRRRPKEPVFKTTITEAELRANGVFRAFVDLGDVPPERWPNKATMVITE